MSFLRLLDPFFLQVIFTVLFLLSLISFARLVDPLKNMFGSWGLQALRQGYLLTIDAWCVERYYRYTWQWNLILSARGIDHHPLKIGALTFWNIPRRLLALFSIRIISSALEILASVVQHLNKWIYTLWQLLFVPSCMLASLEDRIGSAKKAASAEPHIKSLGIHIAATSCISEESQVGLSYVKWLVKDTSPFNWMPVPSF